MKRFEKLWTILPVFAGILLLLFWQGFLPGHTFFSNDGPLGSLVQECRRLPGAFFGEWDDLNSIGYRGGGALPSISYAIVLLLGPVGYSRFNIPVALLILGLGAWCFFRQLKLAPVACVLGGIAAMLAGSFFSAACWGVSAQCVAFGMTFFALAAVTNARGPILWPRVMVAGLAVGMAVTEGADIGALFSVYVAAYIMYQGFNEEAEKPTDLEQAFLWICLAGLVLMIGGGGLLWLCETFLRTRLSLAHSAAQKLGPLVLICLCAGTIVLWLAMVKRKPLAGRLVRGLPQLAIVVLFAALLAAQTISTLIATQISGIQGTEQNSQAKAQRWDFATQWSLPKKEALGLIVPGLFGYRMDTPGGGSYWGLAGSDPAWDRYWEAQARGQTDVPKPGGIIRFGGGGHYAGVLVVLLAIWAGIQVVRGKNSVFALANRRGAWFWIVVVAVSLPLAFGRFAPFYQIPYFSLPLFSTVRNPAKFLHPTTWGLVILFAYGIHGLWRQYMERRSERGVENVTPQSIDVQSQLRVKGVKAMDHAKPRSIEPRESISAKIKSWWQTVCGFDRRWTLGCLGALAACLLAWLLYAANQDSLVRYLQEVQIDATTSEAVAKYSIGQVGWFLLFLMVAIGLMIVSIAGVFSGRRAKWGVILLGLFLVVDLGRAGSKWIVVWNYQQKYASDQILDMLREKPYEHRVAGLPLWLEMPWFQQIFKIPPQIASIEQYLRHGVYGIEWAQHQFLYYNIQSLDLVQLPRMPEDLASFNSTFELPFGTSNTEEVLHRMSTRVAREWQLTNTRYLLGAAGWLDFLNQQVDPGQHRFRIVERFEVAPKPGVTQPTDFSQLAAVPATNGPFALYEFTGALPRAKLYTNWLVNTNNQEILDQLTAPGFDPEKTVLVNNEIPAPAPAATTNAAAGTVEFASYGPTDLKLKATPSAPSVLLLNDRYGPNWHAFVDGNPAPLLRCNYLMRGLYLTPGTHAIEFRFQPPENMFYVSLSAIILGVALCGILLVRRKNPGPEPAGEPLTEPSATEKKESLKPEKSMAAR